MIKINLLPHRQVKREERKREFTVMVVGATMIAMATVFLGWMHLSGKLETQNSRNARLEAAITQLNQEISGIKKLQDDIKALLARKTVVENLQISRGQAVVLLDLVARQLPDGVVLKLIKQKGTLVTLEGLADTQARVSALSHNLEASNAWVSDTPIIVEIKSATENNQKLNDFTLSFNLKAPQAVNFKEVKADTDVNTDLKKTMVDKVANGLSDGLANKIAHPAGSDAGGK